MAGKFFLLVALTQIAKADTTWMYAVQISAAVQSSPPRINLSWSPDPYGATNYIVYRKTKSATSWGTGTMLPGSATNYTDSNVTVGSAYEYRITKAAILGFTGYGYIYAGIEAPLVEDRGKLILIVANTYAAGLSNDLSRLQSDLAGDGWSVIRHDVSSTDTPASVRNLIIADYNADAANVKAVFLFGHVPVLQSGNLNYDGHLVRPMPADAFYGDVDGNWSGSPSYLPSDVELMVGRVDFFDMPGNYAPVPFPSEVELLRNYLNKNHSWRHKLIAVPRRALVGDRRGDELGEATSSSGYRSFEPLVGPGNTFLANTADASPPADRWGPILASNSYVWAYGCGGGEPAGISHLGTSGQYNELWSMDVVGGDTKAVFVMLFGSWFGNWDGTDNFMRAFLATPTMGLTCCMAGRPHWFVHHMGLGESIGYSTRLSMNNSTLYQNQSNGFTRAVYIALMGDPTLRMDPVSPPSALTAVVGNNGVNLNWSASADAILGYHVYRSSLPSGPFSRLTGSLLAETSFTDTSTSSNVYTYMVRAVKLQATPSGSYFNASQGIFATVDATPIQIAVSRTANGLMLQWNSRSGSVYRVQANNSLGPTNWADVIADITATGSWTFWAETNLNSMAQRFYRIASP